MSVTLPTPPSSPSATTHNNNMSQENDALQQLRTLQQYYVNTSQWVTQTRAALFELALAQGAEASTSSSPPLSQQQQQPCTPQAPASPAASDVTSAEPDSADVDMRTARANGDDQTGAASSRASLLARRKNGMKLELKLDGIGARRRYRRPAPNTASLAAKQQQQQQQHQQPQPAVVLPGDHLAHMLQLFGDLVDSRMESCARMERLVRDAAAPMPAW